MNLVHSYIARRLIINSPIVFGTPEDRVILSGEPITILSDTVLDPGSILGDSISIGTWGISASPILDTAVVSTYDSALNEIRNRLSNIETRLSVPDNMLTAHFQDRQYEIQLEDGTIIRATNFTVRQIREEYMNERYNGTNPSRI